MDSNSIAENGVRSTHTQKPEEIGVESLQFNEEIVNLMSVPPVTGSSFTALLELPANQAVKLLHSPEKPVGENSWCNEMVKFTLMFPKDSDLVERASKFSVFAGNSPEPSNSVKQEPVESDSPVLSDSVVPNNDQKSAKRKEREKKVKGMAKKSKNGDEILKDRENLPYVHVRARRGQATDSHSLAERVRREKINARMKLLQELVPGCNKISGTAMVLDEIINHVQSLQRQVEFLSMRLAAVNPRIDINLDSLLASELQNGSLMESNFPGMVMPPMCLEGQVDGNREPYQHLWQFDLLHQPAWAREDDNNNFVTPQNALLSYDSSAHSASLQSNPDNRPTPPFPLK